MTRENPSIKTIPYNSVIPLKYLTENCSKIQLFNSNPFLKI